MVSGSTIESNCSAVWQPITWRGAVTGVALLAG
jgi:hypothetical protein